MKSHPALISPAVAAVLALAAPGLAQSFQTLPAGYDTVEGSSSTAYPLNSSATHKWHWAYDGGQFAATFPILITAIEIRPDGAAASWGPATYDNVTVRLGASQNDYAVATYDPTFDNNWSTTDPNSPHNFFTGNLTVPAGTGGTAPNPWSIRITGTPFLYDPTLGEDFIFEIRTPGSGAGNPTLHNTDGQSGSAGANGGNRYGHLSDPNAATWSFNNNEFVPIIRITYTPAAGLYPGFTATPETGPSPLQVQFTDTSFSSDPNGIQNWAWDVDGDGVTDYSVQNPRHTYRAGGTYDVTLDVTDTMHGTRRLTKTGGIVVDPISASFTAAPTLGSAPLTVQFTDTTTGNPTAWLWDFENDGVIDSTAQNPSFTYSSAGRFSVNLRVTNGANVDSLTVTDMITVVGATNNTNSAELLEFNFNEPRGSAVANTASTTLAPAHATVGPTGTPNASWQGDPGRNLWKGNEAGAGCMAADNVTPYEARVDTGWPVDLVGSHTIMFWTRIQTVTSFGYAFGSTLGSGRCYHDGSGWSLRSWGSLGTNYVISASDPYALTGWNHWAVVIDDATGTGQWYLNGVADGAPTSFTPNTFTMQNTFGNFTIGGYSTTSTFGRYADIDDFRVYGNALNVSQIIATMASENAATGTFGDGCQGPATTPQIGALGGPPTIGSATFQVVTDSLEPGVPQVINFGLWTSQGGLLPFDLSTILGVSYTGCFAELAPDLGAFILGGATGAAIPLPLPNDPTLGGAHVYAQTVVLGSQGAVSPALDINVQN